MYYFILSFHSIAPRGQGQVISWQQGCFNAEPFLATSSSTRWAISVGQPFVLGKQEIWNQAVCYKCLDAYFASLLLEKKQSRVSGISNLWTLQHALLSTNALSHIHSSPGTRDGLWAAGWACLKTVADLERSVITLSMQLQNKGWGLGTAQSSKCLLWTPEALSLTLSTE